jgi:acetyl-CoA synthetase
MDADGYLWYQGRSDDVFKAAGYRIGPSEIENCLVKHPAVANAAVVPKPDAERGAVVKAYVVLAAGLSAGDGLVEELQPTCAAAGALRVPQGDRVHRRLPMTTTGKVQRRVLRLQEEERAAQPGGVSQRFPLHRQPAVAVRAARRDGDRPAGRQQAGLSAG